jgi:hypothetical protein
MKLKIEEMHCLVIQAIMMLLSLKLVELLEILSLLYRISSSTGLGWVKRTPLYSFDFSALFGAAGELKTKPTQR